MIAPQRSAWYGAGADSGGGTPPMKRMMLALCLAAIATAAQAETRDHRHAKAADSPGRAESALRWFAAHAAAPTAASAASHAPAHVAKPHIVTVAVTPSDTPAAAP